MSRIDVLLQRMFSMMPYPTPTEGPRVGRVRIQAAALAGSSLMVAEGELVPGREPQTATAIAQMRIGAHLQRVAVKMPDGDTLAADNWDQKYAAFWIFEPVSDSSQGAEGIFLDQWGKRLGVPRDKGETDASMAKRILYETMTPGITNVGMAKLIDHLTGLEGTEVVDAWDFITPRRLNSDTRLNSDLRLTTAGPLNLPTLWACFIVVLPDEIPTGIQIADIKRLAQRHKSPGTRMVATKTPTAIYVEQ